MPLLYRAITSLFLAGTGLLWYPAASCAMNDAAQVLSVNPGVHSILSGNRTSLQPKMNVPIKAAVKSDYTGNAQLMFPDDSIVTVAPGTEIELAEFVDTPKKENIVIDMTVGTARFITGEVSRRNPLAFTVNTPQAVIGIRGTVITVTVIGDTTEIYLSQTSGKGVSVRNRSTGEVSSLRSPGMLVKVTPDVISGHEATPREAGNIVARMRAPARGSHAKRHAGHGLVQASRIPLNPGAAVSAALLTDTDMTTNTMAVRSGDVMRPAVEAETSRAHPHGPAVIPDAPSPSTPGATIPTVPDQTPGGPSNPSTPPSRPIVPDNRPTAPSTPENPPSVPSVPTPPSIPDPLPPEPAPDVKPGPDAGNYVVNLPLLAGTFTGGGSYVNQAGQSSWDISMKVPSQYALKDRDLIKIEVNGHFWGAQWADPAGFGSEFTLRPDGTFGLANPGSVNISGQFTSNSAGSVTIDSSNAQWKPFAPNNDTLYQGGVVSGPITKR